MGNLMDWFYGQIIGFLGNFFAIMGRMGVELFELDWVQSVVTFFSQLGWALFGVSVVVCCFEFGLDYSTGRGNIQQTALNILKGFLAVSLFSTVPVRLYELSVDLQGQFTAEITGLGTSIAEVGKNIIEDFAAVTSLSDMTGAPDFMMSMLTSPIMLLFCVIAMGYAVIKVFFANLKRGGILLIQIAVGSLYMFSVPRGYTDGFIQWMKQVIGLCLTAIDDPGRGPAGLPGTPAAGVGAHALCRRSAEDRRNIWIGHHHPRQHHVRRLHRPGGSKHHQSRGGGDQIAEKGII